MSDREKLIEEARENVAAWGKWSAELDVPPERWSRQARREKALLTEIERLRAAVVTAKREAFEEAAKAAGRASWMHAGDDAYSQGMDAGARHQVQACVAAIRALQEPK
jgi:hypothetical protein